MTKRWTFTAAPDGDTWTARVLRHPSQKAHVAACVEAEQRGFTTEADASAWAEKQLPIEKDRKQQQRRAKNSRKKAKKQRDKELFNMPFVYLAPLCDDGNAKDTFDYRCDIIQAEIYWRHLKGGADDEIARRHALQQVPNGRKRRLDLALSGELDRVTENLHGIAIANARRIAANAHGSWKAER
tara:strand:+ start:67 stop:618 length:552 start_codon:yes stop_codon:yes gene_type:complete